MTEPRQWDAFAEETGDPKSPFLTICDWEQVLDMSGVPESKRVSIKLIEDQGGDLLGWIYAGTENVVMVQHKRVFSIQFAYGVDAEIERGNGQAVALRAEKVRNLHA